MNVGELLIRISADTSGVRDGVRDARREVDRLPDEHRIRIIIDQGGRGGRGSISDAAGNLGRMRGGMQGVIALAPILAAGIQAVVGAVGGLVSMLGDATIGTVSFGAVATAVLNDVIDAQKEITKATEDMKKAMTEDEKQTALENMAKAYRGLSEEQLAAVYSLQRFKSFWDDYTESFEKPVVIAFAQALQGFQYVIEKLRPTVAAASNAILKVFDSANKAIQGADFTNFFDSLAKNVGPVLETFGYIAIDVMQGLLNIMRAFEPVSGAMQGGLRGISQAFLKWTQTLDSNKIQQFMNFVIDVGPQFITTLLSLMTIVNNIIKVLAPLGAILIGLVNILVAAFNAFTAMALGWDNARQKATDLKNSVFTLLNTLKMLAGYKVSNGSGDIADSVFDIDKAWQDWFGSIGDVTGGLKDADKAAKGFLASFDEVHSIDKNDGGGLTAPTVPKPPTLPGGGGDNPWNQPPMDEPQPGGTDWVQNLIDKLKILAGLIPMKIKIDPPDDGGTGVATIVDGIKAQLENLRLKMGELPPASVGVSMAWNAMLTKMQSDLNAFNPYLTFGLATLGLSLSNLHPTMELTSVNWHTMLDAMQSKLNAYRPYLEFGLQLLGLGLNGLQSAQTLLEGSWNTSWQNMYVNQQTQANKMLDAIESIRSAYVALQQTMNQPVTIATPQSHPSGKQSLVMDDLIGTSPGTSPVTQPTGNSLKSMWENSLYVKGMTALSKTNFMKWIADHPELGSGVGIGGAFMGANGALSSIGNSFIQKVVQMWQSLQGSGLGGAVTPFANGGIIGQDSIVRVGEKGRREAIIPLESSAMMPFANAIASSMNGGNNGNGGDIVIQIDGVSFARVTAPYGVKESRRIGGSMITTT